MSKKIVTKSGLTSKELKSFITHIINNNRFIQKDGKTPIAICVEGEAGLGKTSVVKQVADELKIQHLVKLNLAQIEEIGDLVGFPVKEYEVNTEKGPIWVSENILDQYDKSLITGNKRMGHASPEWIQGKNESGILLLDDFTRADSRFIQATMDLINDQEYISWKLPKDWHIILTTNPDNGDYLVSSIDEAQKTRYITVNMKFDKDDWAKWAEETGIDSRCINFVLIHPELLKGTDLDSETSRKNNGINPRSITMFFNSISSIKSYDSEIGLIRNIGEGCIGNEASNVFCNFISNKLDKLISPKDMLEKDWAFVKSSMTSVIISDSKYNSAIASVFTTRLVNYVNYNITNSNLKVDDKLLNRLSELIKDTDIFNKDLKYVLVRNMINVNKTKFSKLLIDTEIMKMVVS